MFHNLLHVLTKPFNILSFPFFGSMSFSLFTLLLEEKLMHNSSQLKNVHVLYGATKTYDQLFFFLHEIVSSG